MDGILSAVMGMQAEQVQRTLSYAILSKAMDTNALLAENLLKQLPEVDKPAPVMQGEPGFNLDVLA